jgi:hypothetical protein
MSTWESSFKIGWWEYRLDSFRSEILGNSTRWQANIVVVDKLGWDQGGQYNTTWPTALYTLRGGFILDLLKENNPFPSMDRALNYTSNLWQSRQQAEGYVSEWVFGGTREFERARWPISGEIGGDKK